MRGAQRLFDHVGRFAAGEQEPEVAVAFEKRNHGAADRDRDLQSHDARDGSGLVATAHGVQGPGGGDGQHHHTRRGRLAHQAVERQLQRVAEYDFFEADAGAEAQGSRAQPTDRPRGNLDDPHAVRRHVDAELRMHGTLAESQGRRRVGDELFGSGEHRVVVA